MADRRAALGEGADTGASLAESRSRSGQKDVAAEDAQVSSDIRSAPATREPKFRLSSLRNNASLKNLVVTLYMVSQTTSA